MTFYHNQPLYLSCATTPLGKVFFPTFHRLTSNNSTHEQALGRSTLAKLMPKTYEGTKPFYPDSTKPSR